MSTPNFHNVNASKIFAAEIENEWDYDDLIGNVSSELQAIPEYWDSGKDPHELRSYPSQNLGGLHAEKVWYGETAVEIIVCAIVRSGYYGGCNLDWAILYAVNGDEWTDELETDYLPERIQSWVENWAEEKSSKFVEKLESIYADYTTKLRCVAVFSNGEAVYENA